MNDRRDPAKSNYAALTNFRYAPRQFMAFSERAAADCGLTPKQHQALLAILGAAPEPVNVGYVQSA